MGGWPVKGGSGVKGGSAGSGLEPVMMISPLAHRRHFDKRSSSPACVGRDGPGSRACLYCVGAEQESELPLSEMLTCELCSMLPFWGDPRGPKAMGWVCSMDSVALIRSMEESAGAVCEIDMSIEELDFGCCGSSEKDVSMGWFTAQL